MIVVSRLDKVQYYIHSRWHAYGLTRDVGSVRFQSQGCCSRVVLAEKGCTSVSKSGQSEGSHKHVHVLIGLGWETQTNMDNTEE